MLEISKKTIKICHNCHHTIISPESYYTIQKKDGKEYDFCDDCFDTLYGKLQLVEIN